ncbi:hypothetical protein BH10PSE7_BH10PSE7_14280 [soil metagenome]
MPVLHLRHHAGGVLAEMHMGIDRRTASDILST